MKDILVTGANGMLGSSLSKEIKAQGKNVIEHSRKYAYLNDQTHTTSYFNFFKDKIDTVVHCAAKVGGVKANLENNSLFFKENIDINNNVLQSSMDIGVENFASILSTCIFPDKNVEYPLTSDQLDNGLPHPSNIGYAYAKRLLYFQTKMYRNYSGYNWVSIVPTNLFGNNDCYDLNNSHLIPALIRKGYEASINNTDFDIWGDGTPLRQFVHADDLSKIILYTLDTWKSDKAFMAVNTKEYSIKEVANIIADRFGLLEKMNYQTDKPNGQFKKPASTDVPQDFKFMSLEEGINKSIDWFIENKDNCRL